MSKDKLRIFIKILAESHMAFDWEIKSTFEYTPTDQPYSIGHLGFCKFHAPCTKQSKNTVF